MKKRTAMLLIVFALVAVAVGVFQVKNNYPDLEAPIINRYIGDVEESPAGSRYKTYFFDLTPIERQAYNLILAD
ncbi:MAG: hypothetical protein IK097_02665, partial [Clostridia bacterium]|nr:hypothetical protein [Clostridia bacterium]